ncbi:hypothetical protein A2757_02130 [Candidatus Giovannonibacteria bacterium RIFCSPHIGHO2_01_FULL_48_47]|nr:MAG: hypothetical protein A2757_02130 [Candidatus Giovannonibacteria bacterium RIFCSPHIGHO2_01_FULL_48_47]OGF88449.1 MAG: hypothetical protein A3B26_01835 [Candidatus Giovannonibacteria bacterium RIFCSPLOWO2_01_FULL_48_47]OGF96521.1 MAG: hypothetical protein A2613_03145 [Candidatus Giovannonibacteria bacterium RIFOXYD1_FULL_48_21]HBT81195.1 hypothetical protein [Candidatus Giovannonibacteria bacterium]
MKSAPLLDKIEKIEKGLQELKVDFLFRMPQGREKGMYKTEEILKEVRKIRKDIWNERYRKTA